MADISVTHLMIKALNNVGVLFPTSKADIIKKLGDVRLKLSDLVSVPAVAYVEPINLDYFDNGAEFFCAYHSVLYKPLYQAFLDAKK